MTTTDHGSGRQPELGSHVRASALMTLGRVLALGVTFVAQIAVVRYLSAADYGALAWAMGIVGVLQGLLPLGTDRVVSRYLVQARGDRARLRVLTLVPISLVLVLGSVIGLLAWAFQDSVSRLLLSDPATGAVLLIVLALGPAQAIDALAVHYLAAFTSGKEVFVRLYVVQPGLRLTAVLTTIGLGQGVYFLAGAYLVSGLLATSIFVGYALLVVRRKSPSAQASRPAGRWPEGLASVAASSLLAQGVALCTTELAGVLLGGFGSAEDVAIFRAIAPLAMLALMVKFSFGTFFLPSASRLFDQGDTEGLRVLHWRTASWVAVLSAPALWVCVPFAREVTTSLLGPVYVESAVLLAIVATSYYLVASMGYTPQITLLLGRRRWLLWSNLGLLAVAVAVHVWLIHALGPLGAASAVAVTTVLQALLGHLGAAWRSPIRWFDADHARTLMVVAVPTLVFAVVARLWSPDLWVVLLLVALAGLWLLRSCRRRLEIASTFPAVSRVPLLGRWVAP